MPTSETHIANLALAHLGESPVQSLDESSAASRACLLHYAQCRDEVLRAHRWNFAQDRAQLTQLSTAPAFGWSFQYALPALCLRVVEFNDTEIGDVISETFIIEGRRLLTNSATAKIVFIQRITDVSLFDPLFTDALAVKLAIKLSEVIRGASGKVQELVSAYQNMLMPLARRTDANEGRRRKGTIAMNSPALRARFSGGSYRDR